MRLKISDLRLITENLLGHLEALHIEEIGISDDYYWDIPKENLYNPYEEPTRHTLGQLSDDWGDLEQILWHKAEPVIYNFVDLAAVLKDIGQHYVG